MTEAMTLHTLLSAHPGTRALRSGEISSPLVSFAYSELKIANRGFKSLVREAAFDCGELAIVTYLQAKEHRKPYILMPGTIVGRSQHHTIFYNADKGALKATELNHKRVGVRAYTQTTGAWVRGFLKEDYGIDLSTLDWVTFEDAHIAEYRNPFNVALMPETKTLKQMLLDGEIAAAILGDVEPEEPLQNLIPDHEAAAKRWALTHGGVPVNHLMVMKQSIARNRPDVVREVYRLLKDSRARLTPPTETGLLDPLRFSIEEIRKSVESIVRYALEQKLITTHFTVDELFADFVKAMNA
jgi:4,5-dihydroxyphthalate decarboxylase